MIQVGKEVSDTKQLAKRLADSEVELQKSHSLCRELEDRVMALDADNCQLKHQLSVNKDQLDRVQHQLFDERKVPAILSSLYYIREQHRNSNRIKYSKRCTQSKKT